MQNPSGCRKIREHTCGRTFCHLTPGLSPTRREESTPDHLMWSPKPTWSRQTEFGKTCQMPREVSQGAKRARKLRESSSVAEIVAWKFFRNSRTGFKFRRQHPIGKYVVDFYCDEAKLVVEFDGEQHDPVADKVRDLLIKSLGLVVFRIPNREFFNIDQTPRDYLSEVIKLCEKRTGRDAWNN